MTGALDSRQPQNDPLLPPVHRFPVNAKNPPLSDEPPSSTRPFILRDITARQVHPLPASRHRTAAGNTYISNKCNSDGKMIEDGYTVPDD